MPYIEKEKRERLDGLIKNVVSELEPLSSGEKNYFLSSVMWGLFNNIHRTYSNANNIIGLLECVKLEFYRRKVAELEDEKMIENGDI